MSENIKIIDIIAKGAFSSCYLAKDLHNNLFALKKKYRYKFKKILNSTDVLEIASYTL